MKDAMRRLVAHLRCARIFYEVGRIGNKGWPV